MCVRKPFHKLREGHVGFAEADLVVGIVCNNVAMVFGQVDANRNGDLAFLEGVSGFLCLGRLFQGQPNEAALCI